MSVFFLTMFQRIVEWLRALWACLVAEEAIFFFLFSFGRVFSVYCNLNVVSLNVVSLFLYWTSL